MPSPARFSLQSPLWPASVTTENRRLDARPGSGALQGARLFGSPSGWGRAVQAP